ncbi:MAG TPA: glycosyl hydrolase [Candidatus Bathyarchaeia archaeon]|nr:glycosyl hydrolase [Candidatus Bathyarchaeia archaeon]
MRLLRLGLILMVVTACVGWAEGQESAFSSPDAPLAERFANPPASARILKIVHVYPDGAAEQEAIQAKLVAQGFGGMATNVSFNGYIEDPAKWESFTRWVGMAKDAGLALWLYDEHGYPSGAAFGITLRDHPEWEAWGLYETSARTAGGPVTLDLPPGVLVRAAAFPVHDGALDLGGAVDLAADVTGSKLTWEAPAGEWHVMAITQGRLYEGTHAELSLADKLPYINLLMAEPTARFLEVTHGTYAGHLGDDLGRYFIATFTDEPSLMSMFLREQPWRILPWSPNLPIEFEKRRGYALDPVIPALFEDGGTSKRARYDFWLTVGELVSENFFGQIQDWCRDHNVLSGGHPLFEEPLLTHVPLYGDFFRCVRRLDAPSIDCLTSIPRDVPWYIARLISSAAELEGRTVTMCETSDHSQRYRPKGDDRPVRPVSEDEIRGTCNRLIANGITTITSYYSFAGLTDEQLQRLNTWIGRCTTMLEGGQQVADIAVVYPIETLWPRFTPAHHMVGDSPYEARKVERVYRAASESLYHARHDFTYIDGRTLCEGSISNGALNFNGRSWRVIILPCADTLPMKAWENLEEFHRTGGIVIALADLPANSDLEFPSPRVQELGRAMFHGELEYVANPAGGVGVFVPLGSVAMFSSILDGLIAPDVRVSGQNSPVRYTHRRIDGHEVFFLINDSETAWEGSVSLAAAGEGERWNPETGAVGPVESPENVAVALGPYGGVFFRFAQPRPPERHKISTAPTALSTIELPSVEPTAAHGEYVDATLTPIPEKRGWNALAKIKKSDVDTFFFLQFAYPNPVDLSGAASISFDAETPPGQSAGTSLLVILRDKNGVEYFADTGYPLRGEAPHRCSVPMALFEHAGFSRGPEGPLDFAAVSTISIGWGGYTGTEGDTVEFTIANLEAASTQPKP